MMAPPADRRSAVNRSLTPKRRKRVTENDEYAAFVRRVIRGYSRRVASGDIDALADMTRLAAHLDQAITDAVPRPAHWPGRLLLGRHCPAARHHPASRPATMGRPRIMTGDHHPIMATIIDGTPSAGSRP